MLATGDPAQRIGIETRLESALNLGEFEVHYQPMVRVESGELIGLEALARWQNPELGLVPPDRFIPAAEEIGLIASIDEWVACTACKEIEPWQLRTGQGFRLAVNISARHFEEGDLVRTVRTALKQTRYPPECLELEVTERVLIEDTPKVAHTLAAINEAGLRLALDDFGRGYSALSYLKRYPFDSLKIDRSFVNGVPEDATDCSLVTIVHMALGLGLEVIAEGVEREDQLQFLRSLECDLAQGYHFSPPLASDAFEPYAVSCGAVRLVGRETMSPETIEERGGQ